MPRGQWDQVLIPDSGLGPFRIPERKRNPLDHYHSISENRSLAGQWHPPLIDRGSKVNMTAGTLSFWLIVYLFFRLIIEVSVARIKRHASNLLFQSTRSTESDSKTIISFRVFFGTASLSIHIKLWADLKLRDETNQPGNVDQKPTRRTAFQSYQSSRAYCAYSGGQFSRHNEPFAR
jgi:hypothetical protein